MGRFCIEVSVTTVNWKYKFPYKGQNIQMNLTTDPS